VARSSRSETTATALQCAAKTRSTIRTRRVWHQYFIFDVLCVLRGYELRGAEHERSFGRCLLKTPCFGRQGHRARSIQRGFEATGLRFRVGVPHVAFEGIMPRAPMSVCIAAHGIPGFLSSRADGQEGSYAATPINGDG